MTIFIRISPLVLAIAVVAIVMGHMGGISVAIAAVGIGLAVAVPGAVIGGLGLLWWRLRREIPSHRGLIRMTAAAPPRELPGQMRMLGPPQWRIPDDQIEQIAEIIRRSQRPEQEERNSHGMQRPEEHEPSALHPVREVPDVRAAPGPHEVTEERKPS